MSGQYDEKIHPQGFPENYYKQLSAGVSLVPMEPKEKYEEEIYICDNILGLESLENEKSSESEYDYDYECERDKFWRKIKKIQ